jgi:hypothetical protein
MVKKKMQRNPKMFYSAIFAALYRIPPRKEAVKNGQSSFFYWEACIFVISGQKIILGSN